MAVHIIADSSCDIPQSEAARRGLQVLPFSIHFGTQEYRDGVDITGEKFYQLLTTGDVLPTTSQVTPWQFQEALAVMEEGDEAVILTVSGKLSGTLQSALIAAKSYGSRVRVVDSLSAAIGLRVQVEYALRLRDAGLDAAAIAEELLARRDQVVLLGVVVLASVLLSWTLARLSRREKMRWLRWLWVLLWMCLWRISKEA